VLNDFPTGAPVPIVITANFAFRTSLFHLVGGFDERYLYGSDTDFGWLLADHGIVVRSVEAAGMTMDWGTTRRHFKRSIVDGRGKGRHFILLPHHRRDFLGEGIVARSLAAAAVSLGFLVALLLWRPWLGLGALVLVSILVGYSVWGSGRAFESRPASLIRVIVFRVVTLAAFAQEILSGRSHRLRNQPRTSFSTSSVAHSTD
jgi:hypothetical protein